MNSTKKLCITTSVLSLFLLAYSPASAATGVTVNVQGGVVPGTSLVLTPHGEYGFPTQCVDPDDDGYVDYCLGAYPDNFLWGDGGYYFLDGYGHRHFWNHYNHNHHGQRWHHDHHDHHGGHHGGGHHGGGHHGGGHHGGGHHGGGHHGGGHHGGGHHGGGHHGGGHHGGGGHHK